MPFYETLLEDTAAAREAFLARPLVRRAVDRGVSRETYVGFLEQAYHHVRHTCPLLSAAVVQCGPSDRRYVTALLDYIAEERGHEEWILEDIAAMGGDAEAVRNGAPALPCRLMVAYVYFAVEHLTPYAMLGMVHVLEGMSAALATHAAASIRSVLGGSGDAGFSYLSSHGSLDQEHVAFFRDLVNGIDDAAARRAIVETAIAVYKLYGDMFDEIDARFPEACHAT
jgi:pyrroloquinoline quinone (PQQ) biosynthesis protein C